MPTVSRRFGFALAAFAFLVAMLGTTLPTPLYPLFEQRYSFGELMVTVIFAVYAFGVIAGLLVFGNLSDEVIDDITRAYAPGTILYGGSALVGLVAPWVSAGLYLAIALFYALPLGQWRAQLQRSPR